MREDMSKILVERPRIGSNTGEAISRLTRRSFKQKFRLDPEDAFETRQSIQGHLGGPKRHHKELNENLKPLRRFLLSKVGKPWNDVYSEIMSNINLNNAAQYHVWQHLIQLGEVQTKTYMEGNAVMVSSYGSPRQVGYYGQEEFYVHPVTRKLECAARKQETWRKKDNRDNNRYIDLKKPLIQWHKINGIWYEIKFRNPTTEETKEQGFGRWINKYDSISNTTVREWVSPRSNLLTQLEEEYNHITSTWYRYEKQRVWGHCCSMFGGPYFPIGKRQISSKEVKRVESMMTIRDKKAA